MLVVPGPTYMKEGGGDE